MRASIDTTRGVSLYIIESEMLNIIEQKWSLDMWSARDKMKADAHYRPISLICTVKNRA